MPHFTTLRHPEWTYARGLPAWPKIAFRPPDRPQQGGLELCTRILGAWRATRQDAPTASALWDSLHSRLYGSLTQSLEAGDPSELQGLLGAMFQQPFIVGIAMGDLVFDPLRARYIAIRTVDRLVSLAEWLGVADLENPDQEEPGRLLSDLPGLVERLEERIGISLDAPAIGAPYGIDIGGRLITHEAPEHLYVALRLRGAIGARIGEPLAGVVEVGGGFGGMAAWYLRTAGAPVAYSIVDLPLASVLQAWFLGSLFGAEAVQLAGEARAGRFGSFHRARSRPSLRTCSRMKTAFRK